MRKTGNNIVLRLTILGILTAILILCMIMSMGPVPEGIRVSTIDIGETIRAYMK